MSLKRKLFIIIFSIGMFAFMAPSISSYIIGSNATKQETIHKMESILESKMYALQEQISHLNHGMSLLTSRTHLKKMLHDFYESRDEDLLGQMIEELTSAKQSAEGIHDLGILDLNGEIIVSTSDSARASHEIIPPQLKKLLQLNNFQFYLDENNSLYIYLTQPLSINEKRIGYLTMCHDTKAISQLVTDFSGLGKTGFTSLSKQMSDSTVLLSGRRIDDELSPWRIVDKSELGKICDHVIGRDHTCDPKLLIGVDDQYIAITEYFEPLSMAISVRIATSEAFRSVQILRNALIAAAIVAYLLIWWLSIYLANLFTRPINKLTQSAKQISEGDYSQKVLTESQDEIGELAHSFNVMIDNLSALQKETQTEAQKAQIYLNTASTAMLALDQSGMIILANPFCHKALGYNEGELIGKNWFDTCLPLAIRADVKKVFQNLMQGEIEPVEYYHNPILSKSGEERLFAFHNSILTNDSGEIIGTLSSGTDITEHNQIQEALRASEENYRNVVQDQTEFIMRFKPDGTRIFVNDSYCRVFNTTPEAALNTSFFDDLPPEQVKRIKKKFSTLSEDNPVMIDEHKIVTGDGTSVWHLWTDRGVFDESGVLIEIQGVGHDITERKQSENESQKLAAVVNQSPASIVITDTDGNIEYVNPKFVELTGYRHEEAIGQKPSVLKSGAQSDEYYRNLWETISAGKTWTGEFQNKKKNGELYWESASISPLVDTKGKTIQYLAVKEDITERKLVEEILRDNEEKYRLIVENANDGIEIVQNDHLIYSNTRLAKMLGYTVDEIVNIPFHKIFTEEGLVELNERDKKRKAGQTLPNKYETTLLKKDGSVIDVDVKYEIISYLGAPATFSIIRDISDQKLASESLTKYAKRQEQLLETAHSLGSTLNVATVLDQVGKKIQDLLSCEGVTVYLLDESRTKLNPAVSHEPKHDKKIMKTVVDVDHSLTGQVVKAKKGMIFNDASNQPGAFQIPGTPKEDDDHLLIVPLLIQEEAIGAI